MGFDAVIGRRPSGEAAEVITDGTGISAEVMRPIAVVEHPILIRRIIGIASDVMAPLQYHTFQAGFGETLGNHESGKTCASDEDVDSDGHAHRDC